ncbi:gp207 [Bacillus phage G]|uniref:Gp207 n=1 Tax=Bacillus phage G TaxID=2884420 RepID=G3MBS3_9CAUD|nr:gp207 [Bacillus phage G]AEO93466.1 gp207 [Bacillus phage G]
MRNVKIETRGNHMSGCNFCDKSETRGNYLLHLYEEMFIATGNYVKISICSECIEELARVKDQYHAEKIANILASKEGKV